MSSSLNFWPKGDKTKKQPEKPITDKKYTLFIRGELTLNWDDLGYLQNALKTVPNSRSTYIQYNENGLQEYRAAG